MQFREKSDLVFFLILPIVFTSVMALSQGQYDDPNVDRRFPLLVVDQDDSALSQQLLSALGESAVVRADLRSQADADAAFTKKDAMIPAIVTIPSGFGTAVLAGEPVSLDVRRAPSDQRVLAVEQEILKIAGQLDNAVLAARSAVAEAERIRPFAGDAARQAYLQQSMALAQEQLKSPAARVQTTQSATIARDSMTGAEMSSAGQLVTWVMITFLAAAAVFVDERLGGTLRRLATTPTHRATIIGGKVLGRMGAGLLQMALLIVFGAVAFKVQWARSPLALAAIMVAFAIAAVSLGVMLGTFAKTRSQAGGMVILFAMLLSALGGAWWPLEITPPIYQTTVRILPTTWAMEGFNHVLVRGADLRMVLPQVGVLLLFAVVFLAVGVKRLRFE
jgi:ABC-2 type transport system permease protein